MGQSRFSFKAGNLDFSANSLQWLVVSGNGATLRGTGTINGSGNYTFAFSGVDGPDGTDYIRFKVADLSNNTIYDTQPGYPDFAFPLTPLTLGAIKIH